MSSSPPSIVRDSFVQTLRSFGVTVETRVADHDEFRSLVRKRLRELACEVVEHDDSTGSQEDLIDKVVDVREIVTLLAAEQGLDEDALEAIRAAKEKERGAFKDRIVWSGNLPDDESEPTS